MPSATSCTIWYSTSHQSTLTFRFIAFLASLVCGTERLLFWSRYGAWVAEAASVGIPSALVAIQWQMERWRYLIAVARSSRRTSAATCWATVTSPEHGPFHISAGASRYEHRSVKQSTILKHEGSGAGTAGATWTSIATGVSLGS